MKYPVQVLFAKADNYFMRKQAKKAIKPLTIIILSCQTIQQEKAIAYIKRGELYHKLKEYEKAVADYTKAIELTRNNK